MNDQIYQQAIANGCSERLADMLASRKAPGAVSDREFFAGKPKLDEQFKRDKLLEKYIATARAHGYNPSPNDVYMGQLARFPGDPEAFVSATGGRNQVRRTLEKRGWGSEGIVNVQAAQNVPEPPPAPKLSQQLVNECVSEMIAENPDLKHKPRKELEERAIDKHGSPKKG